MIKLRNLGKEKSVKSNAITTISVTTVIVIAISGLLIIFAGPINTIWAYAEQTDTINASKIIKAAKDKMWNIISNVDKNPDYWPISIVKNINKSNSTIEREVSIPAPPFMDNKAYQIITIIPEQYKIIENQTRGAVTGVKTISLLQAGPDVNRTEISVVWNLDMSKIPGIGKGIAKDGINNSIKEALNKIENASN
jgi:hypothetical protein